MEVNNIQICNVCLKSSMDEPNAVFVKAMVRAEEVHVCTGCIPTIIHGSGDAVKSNETVKAEVNL